MREGNLRRRCIEGTGQDILGCPLLIGCMHLRLITGAGIHGIGMLPRLGRCFIENIGIATISTVPIIGEMTADGRTGWIAVVCCFVKEKK